ncbi:hypothetical protein M409DRAFT_56645 [Zasmidium cellare ATCC 36951]|uniref:Zn(2)-C6 fungal-type domain-containing protein n=1 Tax=Zasmidium cellare ATCC 36951 TaxID=1080233 RepID=A0A6A6CEL6_ZASCE|nr:uncharacterized protein M409DRAFT_56645 [Zasmidium cellare ATCC 36951]KAF2164372.1 hypothetical protein M409DRAFT_56645 [Zasmidium cellare ATCC 36951]
MAHHSQCNLARPSCRNCVRRKEVCPGYLSETDTFTNFIVYAGTQRPAEVAGIPSTEDDAEPLIDAVSKQRGPIIPAWATPNAVSSANVARSQFIVASMSLFRGKNEISYQFLDMMDISHLNSVTLEQRCLTSAMDAFSQVQFASTLESPDLARAARSAYDRSLHHLRSALALVSHEDLPSYEILVTILILVFCGHYDVLYNDWSPYWHKVALERMLIRHILSPTSQQVEASVLLQASHIMLFRTLVARKACILDCIGWPNGHPANESQRPFWNLLTIGVKVPRLLENSDSIMIGIGEHYAPTTIIALHEVMAELDTFKEDWYQQYDSGRPYQLVPTSDFAHSRCCSSLQVRRF